MNTNDAELLSNIDLDETVEETIAKVEEEYQNKKKIFADIELEELDDCVVNVLKTDFDTNGPSVKQYKVFLRDNFQCIYCGRSPITHQGVVLHAEHIIPKNIGGNDMAFNIVTSCSDCNWGKHDYLLPKELTNQIINEVAKRNEKAGIKPHYILYKKKE
jgi:hypothetical protein